MDIFGGQCTKYATELTLYCGGGGGGVGKNFNLLFLKIRKLHDFLYKKDTPIRLR